MQYFMNTCLSKISNYNFFKNNRHQNTKIFFFVTMEKGFELYALIGRHLFQLVPTFKTIIQKAQEHNIF